MSKIKLIREKYQYVDKQTGEIKDRTLNIPHYFCEIVDWPPESPDNQYHLNK